MKNKLIFKLTLSKKIFILILIGFVCVEYIHAQALISNSRYSAEGELWSVSEEVGLNELAWEFYENYDSIEDKQFLTKVKELDNRQVALVNKDIDNVDKKSYMSDSTLLTTLVLSEEEDKYYKIVFNDDDQEFLSKLESDLQSLHNTKGNAFDKYITLNGTKEEYTIDDIIYLSIDNKVLIGSDNDKKVKVHIESYVSPTFRLYPGYNEWYINEDEVLLKCLSKLKNDHFGNEMLIEYENSKIQTEYIDYFDENGTLYFVKSVPLVSKADIKTDGLIDKSKIKGYLVYYDLNTDVLSQIYTNVIDENKFVYIIDFIISIIISFIISFMLTKRVKKISTVTEKISNNNFDIKLKERPSDELGILSKNINSMSEQLKGTIYKLNEEIENVKKLESVRKEFIANFTHEIKTPLGIIDGYIELIEECKNEEKKQKYFKEINKETERINGLVISMLKLSRLESGKVELHIQDIDIEDMITSIIDSFTSLLEKKDIKVKLNGENAVIQADPFELEMVIKNFMSNAIKHTPQGCYIEIMYNQNEISIENEGSSITEEQSERIWDTYVSSDREGTGLGLAICKTILDIHGFQYKVENTDKGVRFTFTTKAPID
ncbi:MAG: ATP-binding protein [Coprobacillus sp.]